MVIRSEETFAEKKSFSFTYAKLLVFGFIYTSLIATLSYYVVTGVLSTWLDPREQVLETKKRVVSLSVRVDSLSAEMDRKERYITDLKKLFIDFKEE